MPVSRPLAEHLAQTLADLYRDMETRLAEAVALAIRSGIRADGDLARLEALQKLRANAEHILTAMEGPTRAAALQAVIEAYATGSTAAVDELTRLGTDRRRDWWARRSRIVAAVSRLLGITKRRDARLADELAELRGALPGVDSIMVLAGELVQRMSSTHFRVLRWVDDAYRDTVAATAPDVLAGTKTRLRAAQVIWEGLLGKGITGFTDRSGRNWELASYVEMAARTTVAQAAVEAHLDRMADAGIGLVIVSNAPQECKLCRPFEGKVLARSGPTGTIHAENVLTGASIPVHIKDTVGGAVAKGLLHPNCRHSLSAYLPGVTKAPTHTEDPEGDEARQRLRELERRLRRAKLKEAALVDPDAKIAAGQKVRAIQAKIRAHVDKTGLIRQRQREQIGTAR